MSKTSYERALKVVTLLQERIKLREQKDKEALETLIKEMKELGWVKRPDTKERYVPHYIEFVKDDKWIVIEWNEFVIFGNNLTVNGYVLIAITKYLQAVKL
jgi:hypothetical protein